MSDIMGHEEKPMGMSKAKYVLYLERDLNYTRLCIGNIVMLQEKMHHIQNEMFMCAACNISVPDGTNQCSAHSSAVAKWDSDWADAIGMCIAAMDGRTGRELHEYIKIAVERGKKAQAAINIADGQH